MALVAGSLAFLLLDRGRIALGQFAAANLSRHDHRRILAGRAWRAGGLVMLGAILLLAGMLPLLGLALVVSATGFLEVRWLQLHRRRHARLAASYLVRPLLLLLTCAVFPQTSHPELLLVLAGAAGASATWILEYFAGPAPESGPGQQAQDCVPKDGTKGCTEDAGDRVASARRGSWSLGVGTFVAQAYASGDILVVKALTDSRTAGVYSLGYKPVLPILIIVALQRDLWLSKLGARGGVTSLKAVLTVTVPLACGLGLLLAWVKPLQIITGVERVDRVTAVLLLSLPLIAVGAWLQAHLIAGRQERFILLAATVGALLSLSVNLVLIPQFGVLGAAGTTLLVEACIALMYICKVRRRPRHGSE